MQTNSATNIRAKIHQAALKRNGDKGADIKAMLGDPTKAGVYMSMISGDGIPLRKISEAMRNSLTANDVLSMQALTEIAQYGLRLTEEAAVDDTYRGLVGNSKRKPDRLNAEIEQKRKVHRAREAHWQAQMEEKAKSDPKIQYWMNRLGLDLHDLSNPVLNPNKIDREMGERISPDVLERTFDLGLFKTDVPEEFGGFHFNARETDFILRFIPKLGGGLAAHISSHKSIGSKPITAFGTPEQQRYFIPPMANGDESGHCIASFLLTERRSGTNAIKLLGTEARLSSDGQFLILNGDHVYSTNFYVSGLGHLACNIIDEATGTKLPTVIELKLPFRFSDSPEEMNRKIDELWESGIQVPDHAQELSGIRGSVQAYWELHNHRIPLEYAPGVSSILGGTDGIGKGSNYIFGGLNKGRCGFLTFCAAAAELAVNETLENIVNKVRYPGEYSEEGVLADLELVKARISEIATKTEVMKAVSEMTSALVDNFPEMNIIAEAGIGKAFTSDLAIDVIQTAHSLWGGEGYMRGNSIEQALRDILITRTVEGINDVMFQAGAAVSAGPLEAKPKLKVISDLVPSFESGDLDSKDAFGLQLSSRLLASKFVALGGKAVLKHGARGAQKAIQKQQLTLYDLANREAILFARIAAHFKIKNLEKVSRSMYKKEIAALRQFLRNTDGLHKESYLPTIGHMYIEDAKIRSQKRCVEDAMLLKRYGQK